MAPRLHIVTQGCQMNEYDSDRMRDALRASHGFEDTDDPAEADLLVINTCSIREKAQEKVFSAIGRWRALKKAKPALLIGVGGCVASQEGAQIHARAPFVDLVFGPQTLHKLPQMVDQAREQDARPVIDVSFPFIDKFDSLPPPGVRGPTAFVTIMEGCSKFCSFCVVPYTRGLEVSRPVKDVLNEVRGLAERGVREVTLLGQNVNAYRGPIEGDTADLAELLYYVAEIDGIERIRFTTSHPLEFNMNLIDAYRDLPKLVNHLHLPVQSGSDRVLARMKRGHTVLEYKAKIAALRDVRPEISLSSDFIVGYPGETDTDFEATLNLVKQLNFDTSFSFLFSPRPGTPAASLHDDTPKEVLSHRLAILQRQLRAQAENHAKALVGSRQQVLVTGRSKRDLGQLQGRTECNRVVNFHADSDVLIGEFTDVMIREALPNSLRGGLC
ncbi:MAG: tRNA (N6-isopentenyl adenosine(37)-C2)-methylthiotransferase MiaB [Gammaproteobacteria bacterium]|nr:tRNA (N6-isopentenyl adenosine(37)-C2)-methylthiotransferase MiaB [Gammaproteobacteria bacterium]MCY4200854.1 tRNA (N6-isopentenyl adenosine(37)-C2)-methylthiotransferase MiaB [Gammaproteobacteria bacterium]MCY4324273.1 tRNA (N6-isopentenyl adenosine(37)-C2)-methylthiotransferase MiaB [Gammaproteobacteria bacterium]